MTTGELVGYFVDHDDMIAKANRTKEIVCAINKNPSLALKANVTQSKPGEAGKEERVEEDLEEEEMTSTSELDTDLAFFAKKYGKHSMKRGSFSARRREDLVTIVMSWGTSPTLAPMRRDKTSRSM
jgi:hypothetical protein